MGCQLEKAIEVSLVSYSHRVLPILGNLNKGPPRRRVLEHSSQVRLHTPLPQLLQRPVCIFTHVSHKPGIAAREGESSGDVCAFTAGTRCEARRGYGLPWTDDGAHGKGFVDVDRGRDDYKGPRRRGG